MPASSNPQRALVILARAPELGRVKTRLAAELGAAAALAAYRELGALVVRAVAEVRHCDVVVAFTPADRESAMREWLGTAPRMEPQREGDLGARMAAAIAARQAAGAAKVVVIGTDCPEVNAAVVEDAFARLDRADAVFGPASDGGYYLVGVRRPLPALFDRVPWSSPRTLAATLERAAAEGISVALLEELRDIDTAADWRAWQASRAGTGR